MDPDRKGAPLKMKFSSSDVYNKQQIIDIADTITHMRGIGINRNDFKDWVTFFKPLFYRVSEIVDFKLIVISNKSLSSFKQINFLKNKNWKEYLTDNTVTIAYEDPIDLTTQEYQEEYADI